MQIRIIRCSLLSPKIVILNNWSKMCLCAPETFGTHVCLEDNDSHINNAILFGAQKLSKLLAATAISPSRQDIHLLLIHPRE